MTKHVKGVPTRVWKQIRARNEALDCAVYAFASYASLNANLERIAQRMETQSEKAPKEEASGMGGPEEIPRPATPRWAKARGSWSATRW